MEEYSLDWWYENSMGLEKGAARRVDDIIARALTIEAKDEVVYIHDLWPEFVNVAMEEFPNLHPENLERFRQICHHRGAYDYALFLRLLRVQIIPESSQAHFYVSLAFQDVGDLKKSLKYAVLAFDILEDRIAKHVGVIDEQLAWSEGPAYLLHQAACEARLGQPQEALISCFRAQALAERTNNYQSYGQHIEKVTAFALQSAGWDNSSFF